jgi:hypothetical protein
MKEAGIEMSCVTKNTGLFNIFQQVSLLALIALAAPAAIADVAILVDQATLVETDPPEPPVPEPDNPDETEEDPDAEPPVPVGAAPEASYVSQAGFAVTGANFIDAATYIFDMGTTESVTAATLRIPIREVYPQNGAAPLEVTFYSDENGFIDVKDYGIGFDTPIVVIDAALLTQIEVDVTGPVNAAIKAGRHIGFRIQSTTEPGSVDTDLFPPQTGVRFETNPLLEFVPGVAPAVANDIPRFDGFTLQVPDIDVPTVGIVDAQFQLVDPNELTFEMLSAVVTEAVAGPLPLSGAELFDCAAFSPPDPAGVAAGVPSYSVNSGILDIPSVVLNGKQIAVRMEFIEQSSPILFEGLSIGAVQSGPPDSVESALEGGLIVEPAQDFVPLCHGWVLIGDFIRNRVVERNIISGETGAVYPFNTAPDQFTLDRANNRVFMTVFPESERLYRLDLDTGTIVSNTVSQNFVGATTNYTYGFALRDIALGEGGNVFAILFDGEQFNPEDSIPFAETGLWMGLMDPDGNFLAPSIPLESPIRIEYDPSLNHVFLATESNLATFNFDPVTNIYTFVVGTDVAVGTGCTDFDVSPDGTRLAYACPNGNYGEEDFSIADMDPENYFNNDGAWFFGTSPVSATFNKAGTLLVGTDNDKLYVFDVKTHLILEDFELGLLEGEQIKKIRLSEDGDLIYIFLENENRAENSKFYWMPMPNISGTPL